MTDRIVSMVVAGKGDGECLLAVTESGRVYRGRAGRKNPNQWGTAWDAIEWQKDDAIPLEGR